MRFPALAAASEKGDSLRMGESGKATPRFEIEMLMNPDVIKPVHRLSAVGALSPRRSSCARAQAENYHLERVSRSGVPGREMSRSHFSRHSMDGAIGIRRDTARSLTVIPILGLNGESARKEDVLLHSVSTPRGDAKAAPALPKVVHRDRGPISNRSVSPLFVPRSPRVDSDPVISVGRPPRSTASLSG